MVVPFVLSLAWVLAAAFPRPGAPGGYPLSVEPIYAGLAASLLVYAAGWLRPETEAIPMKRTLLAPALLAGLLLVAGRPPAAPPRRPRARTRCAASCPCPRWW